METLPRPTLAQFREERIPFKVGHDPLRHDNLPFRQKVNHLADLIEMSPDHFDLSTWLEDPNRKEKEDRVDLQHKCGTSGCIAGWAAEVAVPDRFRFRWSKASDIARKWLGLTHRQADLLFVDLAWWQFWDPEAEELEHIDAVTAVHVLRKIAENGPEYIDEIQEDVLMNLEPGERW